MLVVRSTAAVMTALIALTALGAHAAADDRSRPKVVDVAHHAGNVYMVNSRQPGGASKDPQLPRGKVQQGERQRTAVHRELHEEIGVKKGDVKRLGKPIAGHDNGKPTQTYVAHLSRPPSGKPIDDRKVVVVPKAQVDKHLASRPGMQQSYNKAKIDVPASKKAVKKAGK